MSSQSSFTQIPSSNVGDAQPANWQLSHSGSVYLSPLVSVAAGQTQGFAIDAFGRQIIIGATPDNNAFIENPIAVGGIYRTALPTYDDGDQATIHHDVNGRLLSRVTGDAADNSAASGNPVRVGGAYNLALPTYDDGDQATVQHDVNGRTLTNDRQVELLSKNAGAVDAQTLRVQATDEDVARSWIQQGPAADNAAAAGNPLRSGGVYNLALPTYGDGDIGSLQLDANGYLRVRDQNVGDLEKNAGAVTANTLRVELTTESLNNDYYVRGRDADNSAPTVNPNAVAGRYNLALPTYDDGDIGYLQLDANGYLRSRDQNIADLDKNAGAVGASTLRMQPTNEALNNNYFVRGVDADNTAPTVNPVPVAGRYESTLPTYGDGDVGYLHVDDRGRLVSDIGQALNTDRLRVEQVAQAAGTIKSAGITVGVAAVRCTHDAAAPDAGRQYLAVQPDADTSTGRFWIGGAGVTANNGKEVFPGETWERENDAGDYYIISDTAAQTVFITEQE